MSTESDSLNLHFLLQIIWSIYSNYDRLKESALQSLSGAVEKLPGIPPNDIKTTFCH